MTAAGTVNSVAPEVRLNGQLMATNLLDRVTSIKIDRSLNMPGRAVVRFDDPGYLAATNPGFKPGSMIAFTTQGHPLFTGEVTGAELEHRSRSVDFVVTIDDPGYKLGLGTKVVTHQQVTPSEIVRKMASEYGLRADVDAVAFQLPYVIHAGSDLDLLNELAIRSGCDWFIDDKTLRFKKPVRSTGPRIAMGDDLLEFTVRTSVLHPGETAVTGWFPDQKKSLVATAAASSAVLTPDAELVGGFVKAAQLKSANKVTDATMTPGTQDEAAALAIGFAQRWISQAVTARGVTRVNHAISLGGSVAVTMAGPASGTYFVTAVQHVYSATGFYTRFTAGDRRPSALVDSLGGVAGSVARAGLVIGIVTAIHGAQNPGMVKVKFPAISETVESNWARVASTGGGASRGMTFLPEVNDEVLVGFEGGDFRRPVVLGGLYNGSDVASDYGVVSGKVERRRITSRAGHAIEFSDGDAPDKQYVLINLAGGQHSLRLGKQALAAAVPSGVPVTLTAGNSVITITDKGDISLTGQNITLKATQKVEISGLEVTVKGSTKVEVSATQVAVKATAQAEVSASGQVAIKGAMVAIN